MNIQQQQELLPLYPLGLLDEQQERLVEAEAAASADVALELAHYAETAARCGLAAAPAQPNERLRSRLLRSIRKPLFRETSPGIFVHRACDRDWTPTPYQGVFVKQVAFDRATDMVTNLVRMDPGAEYPQHDHSAEEQCYVISGDIRHGSTVMRGGDFSRAVAGSHHGRIWTEEGCTLLIVSRAHDEPRG